MNLVSRGGMMVRHSNEILINTFTCIIFVAVLTCICVYFVYVAGFGHMHCRDVGFRHAVPIDAVH